MSAPAATAARCPVCRKPAVATWRPFCSKRCADVDLGRWLTGAYVIAGSEDGADGPGAAQMDGSDPQE